MSHICLLVNPKIARVTKILRLYINRFFCFDTKPEFKFCYYFSLCFSINQQPMQKALQQIELLNKQLQSLLPMKAEDKERLDKKIRLEFNYNSNHIEGNTLTYSETELLLIFDQTKAGHDMRELEEMKAHDLAYHFIREWAEDKTRQLTEADIRSLNEIILVRPFWKDAITPDGQNTRRLIKVGVYKEQPNSVKLTNGEMFHYTSPSETPIRMGELIQWYRDEEEKRELHPVVLAAFFHYKFVLIHPFDDGNGRISRLLMNYILLRNEWQPVVIKSDPVQKNEYLQALRLADVGDLEAFAEYIIKQEEWSLGISIKAANSESVNEPGDLDKKIALLKRQQEANKENQIKLQLSKEVVIDIYNVWLKELFIRLIEEARKFNSLYLENAHYINSSIIGKITIDDSAPSEILYSFLQEIEKSRKKLENEFTALLCVEYGSYKIGKPNATFGCNYKVTVVFSRTGYTIHTDNLSDELPRTQEKYTERFLHQPITSSEIDIIVANFGDLLYKHIEYFLNKSGL